MENEIKVDTVLTSEDVQEFHLWSSLNSRIILSACYAIAYLAIMLVISKNYSTNRLSILAVTAVVLAAALWYITKRNLIKKSKKAFAADPSAQQPQTYTISEEGIKYISESGSGEAKWIDIHKIGETMSLYVVFISSRSALTIPKRFFQSEQDQTAFKDLARKHTFSHRVKFKS